MLRIDNNAAVAAERALGYDEIQTVAQVDKDVHHGDGNENYVRESHVVDPIWESNVAPRADLNRKISMKSNARSGKCSSRQCKIINLSMAGFSRHEIQDRQDRSGFAFLLGVLVASSKNVLSLSTRFLSFAVMLGFTRGAINCCVRTC